MITVVIDVLKNEVSVKDVEDTLETWYDLLNCTCIDITSRRIDGQYYDIVCDDEGLLKSGAIVSAASESGDPMLVGNLAIVNCNEEGELVGLTANDVKKVRNQVKQYIDFENAVLRPVLTCEY